MKPITLKNLRKAMTLRKGSFGDISGQMTNLKALNSEDRTIGIILSILSVSKKAYIGNRWRAARQEKQKDKERDKWFEAQGFKTLRFWNNEILTNLDGVIETVRKNF